ncbi:cupin domain [Novosphingobium sp. PhB165]|uniref:cupin domain-containing protein n=1 Tax=Novosphingobium sp. PhB165 TaxID=2485105 RepID=UPI0010D03F28|nr:cupin domain-containing protein [Novosphingobium sp. PhB165]TCM15322.1 cupin domain [Novosphingobium sp. PhB165]
MAIRVHDQSQLEWRKIGDIPMGWMRDHIDPSELAGRLSFHEPGSDTSMQLMEMRLAPQTLIAPHSHDNDEIFFIVEGSLHWRDKALGPGGSLYIPAGTEYSFRVGDEAARLLNFRARADHSFNPSTGNSKLAEKDHAG